mmetsp:Transcript_132376/g.300905  ORF Transcript_132376/g.300905 Transcript_132376/m.300905 type:complete len:275 (+) Transcript_132376:2-826(+)
MPRKKKYAADGPSERSAAREAGRGARRDHSRVTSAIDALCAADDDSDEPTPQQPAEPEEDTTTCAHGSGEAAALCATCGTAICPLHIHRKGNSRRPRCPVCVKTREAVLECPVRFRCPGGEAAVVDCCADCRKPLCVSHRIEGKSSAQILCSDCAREPRKPNDQCAGNLLCSFGKADAVWACCECRKLLCLAHRAQGSSGRSYCAECLAGVNYSPPPCSAKAQICVECAAGATECCVTCKALLCFRHCYIGKGERATCRGCTPTKPDSKACLIL